MKDSIFLTVVEASHWLTSDCLQQSCKQLEYFLRKSRFIVSGAGISLRIDGSYCGYSFSCYKI